MNNVFSTDEFHEPVAALEMALEQLDHVEEDLYRWKWVVIVLHRALQGFMVLALRGSNNFEVMRDKDVDAWLDAYENNADTFPDGHLLRYLDLYQKIKSNAMMQYADSQPFEPDGTQGWSIKKLNRLRNRYVHFMPAGHLLEVSGLPKIALDVLHTIRFLGWESNNVLWYDQELEKRALAAIEKLIERCTELDALYNEA